MPARTLLLALALALPAAALAQGALTPPGAPAPTMKSLSELDASLAALAAKTESRIAIEDLPGDGANLWVISAPGSYYCRGNLTGVAGRGGIRVEADNVVLDLNGRAMLGAVGAGPAIAINPANHRVVIRNGNLSTWAGGVNGGNEVVVDSLRIDGCTAAGISAGPNSLARNCTVTACKTSGITATMVAGCIVTSTTGTADTIGINATEARDCHVTGVSTTAGLATGVAAARITDCVVENVTGPSAKGVSGLSYYNGLITGTRVYFVDATAGPAWGCHDASRVESSVFDTIKGTDAVYGVSCGSARGVHVRFTSSSGLNAVGLYGVHSVQDCHVNEVYAPTSSAVGATSLTCIGVDVGMVVAPTVLGLSAEVAQDVRADALTATAGPGTGIAAKTVIGGRVINLTATGNTTGIDASATGVVDNSRVITVSGCTSLGGTCVGIVAGTARGSTVQSLTGNLATTVRGIQGTTVHDCVVQSVLSAQVIAIHGIYGNHVAGCTVRDVDNTNASPSAAGIGITVGPVGGTTNTGEVEHNLVVSCSSAGISVTGVNRIVGNTLEDNGTYGITVNGGSVVSDNHTQGHSTGYSATGAGNLLVRNVSVGDTTAFSVSATSRYAPIVVGAGAGVAFDANANFDF